MGRSLADALQGLMTFNFSIPRAAVFDTHSMMIHLASTAFAAVEALLPIFAFVVVASLAGPLALGGWLISGKALAPKAERIDPLKGIQRMFSANALVELLKAIGKFVLVVAVAITVLVTFQTQLLGLGHSALEPAVADMLWLCSWSALAVSASMIVISFIDVPYQIFDHGRKMKMTKQEVKDEMKDSEGKPEVKSKVRQLQRDMAQRRMMEAIPEADVVITNPEHFAVALKYDVQGSGAPVVVAKGTDFLALKIREVAAHHEVTLLELAPLARAIYFTTELEGEIPAKLYLAVAQVLAYVFQLKAYAAGKGRKPQPLGNVDLPRDAYYDHRGRQWAPE